MKEEIKLETYDLLSKASELLESDEIVFEDQKEFIMGVLFIILNRPRVKKKINLVLSENLTTEIQGTTLDKISAVVNKTHLMRGENSIINDDTAIELIAEYLLEHDEFIFHKNKNKILRKPKSSKVRSWENY